MLNETVIEALSQKPVSEQPLEVVECKGVGHPDSICDGIMEYLSTVLCEEYLEKFGRVPHFNLDKALLVAGRTQPRLGGGIVVEPMRLILGDRATEVLDHQRIDLTQLTQKAARAWLQRHLRFVNPDLHFALQNEIRPGSVELTGIFDEPGYARANDTSAASGYAPLSETERLVLATDEHLRSSEIRQSFPEIGEDVKVMGYRVGRTLRLTLAIAFVDRFISSVQAYYRLKDEVREAILTHLLPRIDDIQSLEVHINTLDDPSKGESGMYLTVLGTSAEWGDSGQVGRGNRVNGLCSLNRPQSLEAVAGKNPRSHVGKIYSLFADQLAHAIYSRVGGLREVYVRLCSQIGAPVEAPALSSVSFIPMPGVDSSRISSQVRVVFQEEWESLCRSFYLRFPEHRAPRLRRIA